MADDVLQFFVSQIPGVGIASLAWGAGIAIKAMWKEYKRRGRREHDLKKMVIERGFILTRDTGGYTLRPPVNLSQLEPPTDPSSDQSQSDADQ